MEVPVEVTVYETLHVLNTIESEVFTELYSSSIRTTKRILDWYEALKDSEHSKGNPKDCTHFCWRESTFIPIWKSLGRAFA